MDPNPLDDDGDFDDDDDDLLRDVGDVDRTPRVSNRSREESALLLGGKRPCRESLWGKSFHIFCNIRGNAARAQKIGDRGPPTVPKYVFSRSTS